MTQEQIDMMHRPITDYSEAELRLFDAFGFGDLARVLSPFPLYRACAELAFCDAATGAHVEALRRGLNALNASTVHRKTPEFDALVSFLRDTEPS